MLILIFTLFVLLIVILFGVIYRQAGLAADKFEKLFEKVNEKEQSEVIKDLNLMLNKSSG